MNEAAPQSPGQLVSVDRARFLAISQRIVREARKAGEAVKLATIQNGLAKALGFASSNAALASLSTEKQPITASPEQFGLAECLTNLVRRRTICERLRLINGVPLLVDIFSLRITGLIKVPSLPPARFDMLEAIRLSLLPGCDLPLHRFEHNFIQVAGESDVLLVRAFLLDPVDLAALEAACTAAATPCLKVEYDQSFFGGDYSDVGAFVYLPVALCDILGVEQTFEAMTGLKRVNIIHWDWCSDELYRADGSPWSEALSQPVKSECHSDDHVHEVVFDASPWLVQASDKEISDLLECGCGGDYPADAVALWFEDSNPDLARLFDYVRSIQGLASKKDCCGFECHVDEDELRAWLTANRPELAGESD